MCVNLSSLLMSYLLVWLGICCFDCPVTYVATGYWR